jgi:hypothetical protein
MKDLIKFLVPSAYRKYQELQLRITALETAVDCLIDSPKWNESDGFNGQEHRKLIFRELVDSFEFDGILETGTWIGNTAGYMAKTSGLPVSTCELNKRFHALAKMRLLGIPNINFALSDSRTFLRRFNNDIKRPFIYLDAHWYDDHPLKEELQIICNRWDDFVVMIDDFKVPGDEGYSYEDYGRNLLSEDHISDLVPRYWLDLFFPSLPSEKETGAKRGCVVLTKHRNANTIRRLQSLKCAR